MSVLNVLQNSWFFLSFLFSFCMSLSPHGHGNDFLALRRLFYQTKTKTMAPNLQGSSTALPSFLQKLTSEILQPSGEQPAFGSETNLSHFHYQSKTPACVFLHPSVFVNASHFALFPPQRRMAGFNIIQSPNSHPKQSKTKQDSAQAQQDEELVPKSRYFFSIVKAYRDTYRYLDRKLPKSCSKILSISRSHSG